MSYHGLGQFTYGFGIGGTVSSNLYAEKYYSYREVYEVRAIIKPHGYLFVKYQKNDYAIKAKIGRKTLGLQQRESRGFTPSRWAPLYSLSGEHPIHHYSFLWYDYSTLSLSMQYEIIDDLYIFLEGTWGRTDLADKELWRRRVRVNNPEGLDTKPYLREDRNLTNFNRNMMLIEAGINYYVWRNIALELSGLVGLNPVNKIPIEGVNRYHIGLGMALVFDFGRGKEKS